MKGHIRKRGKSWAVVVELGRDSSGKRRQKWFIVDGTKAEAQAELARILHEMNTGLYAEPERLTVADYLKRWLTDYAKSNCSVRTYERYEELLEGYVVPRIGHLALTKLRPLHIQEMEASLLASGRQRRLEGKPEGLSARTVLHVHRVLRTALQQAVRWQLLVRNPADAVRPPRPTKPEIRVLDEAEMAVLLTAARDTRLYVPVLVALTTGLRRGELLGLRWQDVDGETLRVAQTLVVTEDGLVFKPPKTCKSRRAVAMPQVTVEALKEHRRLQAEERLRLGQVWQDYDLVSPALDGRPWHPATFTCSFRDLCRRAGLQLRFYDLRHSHGAALLRSGVHPKIVSERLGHSTIGLTLDTYSHLLLDMQKQVANLIDESLRNVLGGEE
ncbi:MAG: site-specific integrase [Thermoleophilia bacterium]|nr:site-specific integrase [Thermoleophilia bacterium]